MRRSVPSPLLGACHRMRSEHTSLKHGARGDLGAVAEHTVPPLCPRRQHSWAPITDPGAPWALWALRRRPGKVARAGLASRASGGWTWVPAARPAVACEVAAAPLGHRPGPAGKHFKSTLDGEPLSESGLPGRRSGTQAGQRTQRTLDAGEGARGGTSSLSPPPPQLPPGARASFPPAAPPAGDAGPRDLATQWVPGEAPTRPERRTGSRGAGRDAAGGQLTGSMTAPPAPTGSPATSLRRHLTWVPSWPTGAAHGLCTSPHPHPPRPAPWAHSSPRWR